MWGRFASVSPRRVDGSGYRSKAYDSTPLVLKNVLSLENIEYLYGYLRNRRPSIATKSKLWLLSWQSHVPIMILVVMGHP